MKGIWGMMKGDRGYRGGEVWCYAFKVQPQGLGVPFLLLRPGGEFIIWFFR